MNERRFQELEDDPLTTELRGLRLGEPDPGLHNAVRAALHTSLAETTRRKPSRRGWSELFRDWMLEAALASSVAVAVALVPVLRPPASERPAPPAARIDTLALASELEVPETYLRQRLDTSRQISTHDSIRTRHVQLRHLPDA